MTTLALPRIALPDPVAGLLEMPVERLVLRLSALVILLHGGTDWRLEVPLNILCAAALLHTGFLMSRWVWLGIVAMLSLIHATNWSSIDNHKYLITYWALACSLAVGAEDPARVLRVNARWLIGLCFVLAMVWKFVAGEYLDGSFLHSVFLTDRRVQAAAAVMGAELTERHLMDNRALYGLLSAHPAVGHSIPLFTTAALRAAARMSSWWTLLIEGAIALAFVAPAGAWLYRRRDALLMLFVGTTYVLLPVVGFACILALMGLAQCEPERRRTRLAYIGLLAVIQLTLIPWGRYVSAFGLT